MLQLSDLRRPNFEPKEFWESSTAKKHKISNVPPQSALTGLMILADKLQFIRDKVGLPITMTSCYRSYQLNRLVKGSPTSAHTQGLAADILFKDKTPKETCELILTTGVVFDQMLIEKDILHFGIKLRDKDCRLEIAYAFIENGKWVKRPL